MQPYEYQQQAGIFGTRGQDREAQQIPINIFDADHDIMVVAPMPGVEPDDVTVSVQGQTLTLHGELRGEGQFDRNYMRREWTYGPYHRTVELPCSVDADSANASMGNGVLTVSLPKSEKARSHKIQLQAKDSAEGQVRGHSGHRTEDRRQ